MSFRSQLQQPSQPDLQQSTQPSSKRKGRSKTVTVGLVMLALALISGGMFFAFVGVIQPHQKHVQVIATEQAQALQATEVARTHVKATAAVLATASAYAITTTTATQEFYTQATSGNLTLNDSLQGQNSTKWDVVNNSGDGSCSFKDNAYHAATLQANYLYGCFATTSNFANFAYQVQMTIVQGDYGGIIFRANGVNAKYYYFRVGKDGVTISLFHTIQTPCMIRY